MERNLDVVLWASTLLLCVFSFLFLSSRNSSRRLPPGPAGLPIVGSFFHLGPKPNESLYALSKRYGPLMTLRLGMRTTIVISSAKMAEEILQKHDQVFAGRTVVDAVRALGYDRQSLVWAQVGPQWRERRRICNAEMLSSNRLDAMRGLREEKVRALVRHVRAASSEGRAVDIGQCAFVTALNLMSSTLFSLDVADLESETGQGFKDLMWRIMETAGRPNIADYFPPLRLVDPQGIRRAMTDHFRQMYSFFDEIMEQRLQSYAEAGSIKAGDLLDVLLQHNAETPESTATGTEFTRDTVKALLLDMFLAGSDTGASTVEWAMTELLRQPEKMAALSSELDQAIGKDQLVEEADVLRLPYLQAVMNETLRLHQPSPLLMPHRAEVAVEVCGFVIPKHAQVIVNEWAIGRDPEVFPEPEMFSPERFIESNIKFVGQDVHFMPFGAGRRICPGLPLAQRMVQLMLASLVHSFSWTLPDGLTPEQLDMSDRFGITQQKVVPLTAIPVARDVAEPDA